MSDPMKAGRRKIRWDRWWNEWRSLYRICRGSELCYLLHFPPWAGSMVQVVAHWPSWFTRDDVRFILDGLGFRRGFRMKKPPRQSSERTAYAAPLDGLLDDYPTLAEFLTSTAYDGDLPGSRQTATLLIFAQDGMWKACLRDRQEMRSAWVAAALFNDLLPVLENALGDAGLVWRDDRASGAPEAKRHNPKKGA